MYNLCLFYPINVIKAEPIGPSFVMWPLTSYSADGLWLVSNFSNLNLGKFMFIGVR